MRNRALLSSLKESNMREMIEFKKNSLLKMNAMEDRSRDEIYRFKKETATLRKALQAKLDAKGRAIRRSIDDSERALQIFNESENLYLTKLDHALTSIRSGDGRDEFRNVGKQNWLGIGRILADKMTTMVGTVEGKSLMWKNMTEYVSSKLKSFTLF